MSEGQYMFRDKQHGFGSKDESTSEGGAERGKLSYHGLPTLWPDYEAWGRYEKHMDPLRKMAAFPSCLLRGYFFFFLFFFPTSTIEALNYNSAPSLISITGKRNLILDSLLSGV